jgi:hypothetical protein
MLEIAPKSIPTQIATVPQRTFTTYSLPVSTGAPVCLISAPAVSKSQEPPCGVGAVAGVVGI